MTKNLLIVSATSRNNLVLARNLEEICGDCKVNSSLINLEDYSIPLYTPVEQKKGRPEEIILISEKFKNASGFIFCAPEYNGSIPPILTNLFSWISVLEKDWRLVFNSKKAIIATHSGGGGFNFLLSLRIQLTHLGTVVIPRTITVNNYTKFDYNSSKEKVKQLISLL